MCVCLYIHKHYVIVVSYKYDKKNTRQSNSKERPGTSGMVVLPLGVRANHVEKEHYRQRGKHMEEPRGGSRMAIRLQTFSELHQPLCLHMASGNYKMMTPMLSSINMATSEICKDNLDDFKEMFNSYI